MRRRTFTPEFKRKVVEEHLVGGRTVADLCREYHLGRNLFDSWRKAYQQAIGQYVSSESGHFLPASTARPRGEASGSAPGRRTPGDRCTARACL